MSAIRTKVNDKITKNYIKYLQVAKNLCNKKDEPYDILNETLMEVLELPDAKLNKIFKYIDGYIIQTIKFSSQSKTSKFQYKYNLILTDKNNPIDTVLPKVLNDIADCEMNSLNYSASDILKALKFQKPRTFEKFLRHILTTDDNIDLADTFGCELSDINKIKSISSNVLAYKCSYFEREIFKKHLIEGQSCLKMSKSSGIPLNSLYNAYNRARQNIINELYLNL